MPFLYVKHQDLFCLFNTFLRTSCPLSSPPPMHSHRWCLEKGMQSLVVPASFTSPSQQNKECHALTSAVLSTPGAGAAQSTSQPAGSDINPGSGSGSASGLRGLMATRDIAPGDAVISVPLDLIVSYDTIMASDLGHVLAR